MPKEKGMYRTVIPKKDVYIRVKIIKPRKKGKRGVSVARHIRRTKARARRTGKPRVERIKGYKKKR